MRDLLTGKRTGDLLIGRILLQKIGLATAFLLLIAAGMLLTGNARASDPCGGDNDPPIPSGVEGTAKPPVKTPAPEKPSK